MLEARLRRGWKPTATSTVQGDKVLLALLLIMPVVLVLQRIPPTVVTALPPFIVREPLALALGSLPYALVQGLGLVVLSRRSGRETRVERRELS
jgi:hypothetical protein